MRARSAGAAPRFTSEGGRGAWPDRPIHKQSTVSAAADPRVVDLPFAANESGEDSIGGSGDGSDGESDDVWIRELAAVSSQPDIVNQLPAVSSQPRAVQFLRAVAAMFQWELCAARRATAARFVDLEEQEETSLVDSDTLVVEVVGVDPGLGGGCEGAEGVAREAAMRSAKGSQVVGGRLMGEDIGDETVL